MQRLVLLALSACPGSTAQEIRAWINTHQDRHRFRQAIWEACQKLCYDGLIRKEGSGLQTRYWRVDEGENHGTSPSVD